MPKTVYLVEEVCLVCLLGRTGELNNQYELTTKPSSRILHGNEMRVVSLVRFRALQVR